MENQTKKQCPYCKSEIDASATKCPKCQSDLRGWPMRHLFLLLMGVIIVVTMIIVGNSFYSRLGGGPSVSSGSPRIYVLTEQECQTAINEITAVIDGRPTTKSQLTKNILEQYSVDAGLPVTNRTNTSRYVMPQGECGKTLNNLIIILVQGISE